MPDTTGEKIDQDHMVIFAINNYGGGKENNERRNIWYEVMYTFGRAVRRSGMDIGTQHRAGCFIHLINAGIEIRIVPHNQIQENDTIPGYEFPAYE